MARREFLQLAKPFKPEKSRIAGWLLSEKLDGTRCYWDGGISRGVATVDVPWASLINPKTGEWKRKIKPVATGLWSRYGNPIIAPDWFLDKLPKFPLDGELWAGRGNFQLCRSICAGDSPDPRFDKIRYAVYSMPGFYVWNTGEIKNSNFRCNLDKEICDLWRWEREQEIGPLDVGAGGFIAFRHELAYLQERLPTNETCFCHRQIQLSSDEAKAKKQIDDFLDDVLMKGGEGVVIRDPDACWTPKRVNALLKYKPWEDDEGTITGFTSGRKTDKGSKHLGKIGALILDFDGKRLELSGLTDNERLFTTDEMAIYAVQYPGVDMPDWFRGKYFKLGQQVTFKFRELSDDGIPKEARYWRKRDVE